MGARSSLELSESSPTSSLAAVLLRRRQGGGGGGRAARCPVPNLAATGARVGGGGGLRDAARDNGGGQNRALAGAVGIGGCSRGQVHSVQESCRNA